MNWRYRLIGFFGSLLIRVWGVTWRIRVVDDHYLQQARDASGPVLFAFWHGRLLPLSYYARNSQIQVLASQHRDGEMLGQTIGFLGFGHVRGSSRRGGAQAIRDMVSRLGEGFSLGVTVDGPTGPRYVVKPGPVEVARRSGCMIVPATTGSRRHWTLRTWDGFELPWPFAEIRLRYGPPLAVPEDADGPEFERYRIEIEQCLKTITEANDESFSTH